MSPGRIEEVVAGATSFAPVSEAAADRAGPELALERILGKNDLIDVRFLEAGFAGRTVSRPGPDPAPRAAAFWGSVPGRSSGPGCC